MVPAIPSEGAAKPASSKYHIIPLHRQVAVGQLQPLEVLQRFWVADEPGFLLESAEGNGRNARYSYIGFRPNLVPVLEGNPLHALREVTLHGSPQEPALPPFKGGVVGYLGYESARHFERLPAANGDPPPMPQWAFLRAENMAVFDHAEDTARLVAIHRPGEEGQGDGVERLDEMEARLGSEPELALAPATDDGPTWKSNVTQSGFEAMVDAAREHILAGDAYQIVLSQRFAKPLNASPLDVYRQLRRINPSPYMYFISLGTGRYIIGTSPELLVRVDEKRVETRPLAGTRRRGRDEKEDRQLEQELLQDPKERAEHVMLVDLGRNDIGRVAKPGTVRVEKLMEVERYSHVMHMSSTVSGQLAKDQNALDALQAVFPAGTVSGAPKIRAMEIIAELEPDKRGPYAGAAGYVGFGGNLDMAITLRTIVIAGGMVYVQAGAGIVADSRPEREYEETLEKAAVMFQAVERAEAAANAR